MNEYLKSQFSKDGRLLSKNTLEKIQHRFFGKLLFLVFIFHFSCQEVKTSNLLPQSSSILLKVNLPELVAAKENQKLLNEVISNKFGLNIVESGLDFFQPVYFFKTTFEEKEGYFLLAGLVKQASFIKILQKLNPSGKVVKKEAFNCMDIQNARVVWNDKFCLFEFFDPILGAKFLPEELISFLEPGQISRGKDAFPTNKMISFRADIQEENTLPLLPPLDANISGNVELNAGKWKMDAVLTEGQFSSFLKPFDEPDFIEIPNCNINLAIKPDWEKLGNILSNYFEIPHLQDLILKLSTINGPILASGSGCSDEEMQKMLAFKAEFGTEKEAESLVNTVEKLGQVVLLPKAFKLHRNQKWLQYAEVGNSEFSTKGSNISNEQVLFKLVYKQAKSDFKLKFRKGTEKDKIEIEAEILHPEMIVLPETGNFLDKLPL